MDSQKQRTSSKENTQMQDIAVITGYRISATGVFGYNYYLDRKEFCSISGHVLPSWPLNIRSKTKSWKTEFFDMKTHTKNNTIRDSISGNPVFRFHALENGLFQIVFPDDSSRSSEYIWEVSCQKDQYFVYEPSASTHPDTKPIAMIERSAAEDWIPEIDYMDVQPYFRVSIYDWSEKTEEDILAILSLPSILRT